MHILKNFINELVEPKTDTSKDENNNYSIDIYKNKYYKYKKKYLELKEKLKNQQIGGSIEPKGVIDFDIYIAGQTNPKNIFQKANVKQSNGKYYISINLPIHNMGPVSYPLILQDGKVYTTDIVNGNKVIRFKYKDDGNTRIIEFKYNSFLRKRFSIIRGSQVLNIM